MKKALLIMALLISCIAAMAQKGANVFTGYLYNSEYQVFLKINFVEKNVVSETQPLFGEMPGYFGAKRDMREWFITDAKVVNKKTAKLRYKKKLKLKATVTPWNATNKNVKWSVSKAKYAKVTQKGVVTAKKKGIGHTVKVYAVSKADSSKKVFCKVKIRA